MLSANAAVLIVSLAAAASGAGVTPGAGDASGAPNSAAPGSSDSSPAQENPQAPLTPGLVMPGTNAPVPRAPGAPEFANPDQDAAERQTLRSIRDAVRQGAQPGINFSGPSTMGGVQGLRVFRGASGFVLTGTVHSQEEKDAAEQRAEAASGGVPIINRIIVR